MYELKCPSPLFPCTYEKAKFVHLPDNARPTSVQGLKGVEARIRMEQPCLRNKHFTFLNSLLKGVKFKKNHISKRTSLGIRGNKMKGQMNSLKPGKNVAAASV